MILQIHVAGLVTVVFDDEITDVRPTPEVMNDYATRLRQQAIDTYMAIPDAEYAEDQPD